jgi:putative ABC transport system permease protein
MLRRGMAPVLAGLAVGIPLALLATRLLRSLLYEVSASDPATFVGVAALLAAVALVASWIPSRRAARVDPMVTLRAD